jgi:RNA polymerase sigma-70 factor (ECF subfamily)
MNERIHLDSFLFEELKAGNPRAFDKIFKDQYQNLCRYAFLVVRDEDTAHSLVQQVFVKLWENRSTMERIEHFTPYLIRMVRNHCINHLRREKHNIQLADIPDGAQTGNTTENQIDANAFEEALIIALSLLPERCKMAFEYSRFANYTNKEIALKMDISIKGVEALIGRALKLLRISMAEYLPSARRGRYHNPILFALFKIV